MSLRRTALPALLVLLAAAATTSAVTAQDAPTPPPTAASQAAPSPGLEPFKESRFWKVATEHVRKEGLTGPALKAMQQEFTVVRSTNAVAAAEGRDVDGTKLAEDLILGFKVDEARKIWFWQVPIVLDQLAPLWAVAEWDADQLARAQVAADFFARQSGPPRLVFAEGRSAENHAQLEALADWFRKEVAQPESYALMIVTDDDGPWRPVESKPGRSKETATRELDAERTLVIRRDEKPDAPWLVQLHKGKKVLWTRALTQVPSGSKLRFQGNPKPLGEHGWVVPMNFGESTALYLDAEGEALFYFTSW